MPSMRGGVCDGQDCGFIKISDSLILGRHRAMPPSCRIIVEMAKYNERIEVECNQTAINCHSLKRKSTNYRLQAVEND